MALKLKSWIGGFAAAGALLLLCHSGLATAGCTEGDCRDGRGTFVWNSGNKYVGQFRRGKRDGQGIFTWANGDKYIGEYQAGKMNGVGTYVFKNGEKYEGEYKQNQRDGYGVYTWPNGMRYEGEYKGGYKEGQGKFTFANGQIMNGVWKRNNFVDSKKSSSASAYALYVNPFPDTAKVRFIGNAQNYYPGVKLKPGRYTVEVSEENFRTQVEVIDILDRDLTVPVVLRAESAEGAWEYGPPGAGEEAMPVAVVERKAKVGNDSEQFQQMFNQSLRTQATADEELRTYTAQQLDAAEEESQGAKNISMIEQLKMEIDILKSSYTAPMAPVALTELAPQESRASPQRRTALVIGNGQYPLLGELKNPENDARDMADLLRKIGFDVIFKLNVNQQDLEEAIADFGSRLKGGGLGLFYYAGHGVQSEGINYLVPANSRITNVRDFRYKAVEINQLLDAMVDARNGANIVLLDACRNNPLPKNHSRRASAGLARTDAPPGTLVVYATSPGSVASDGKGRNGVFTKYLLVNIKTPNVPVETVFKRVLQGVSQETDRKQIPWISSSFTEDFFFTHK